MSEHLWVVEGALDTWAPVFLLLDCLDDPDEALRVYADRAGHPSCLFFAG